MELRVYAFWAINAPLEFEAMAAQLAEMARDGFDGVVFHPRFYPNVPEYLGDEYLAIVSRLILQAKRLGLAFWIYDENGWPSGTVGGALLRKHPEDVQLWADLVDAEPGECLTTFERDGKQWWVALRRGVGVDYLRPRLAQHFIAMTYDRYRTGLAPEAFAHVTAMFSDEPEFGLGHAKEALSNFGAIPWTERLPALWAARYRGAITDHLADIFLGGDGPARIRFWELLTDQFCSAFITPLNDWCARHGLRFTAHVKGEEHPLFQVPTSGSCHQVFRHLSLPAIDALERFPSGHFFPRQLASAAAQFGNGDCMVEAFGGAGWGATPEDLERYLGWLTGHGINHVVLHLYQYRLTSHAIRDWPASIPNGLSWRAAFPELLRRVRARAANVDRSADTLVIAPYRAIMASWNPVEFLDTNNHNAATHPDSPAGRTNRAFLNLIGAVQASGARYHVADERTVDELGAIKSGTLHIGPCRYKHVILADGACCATDVSPLVIPIPNRAQPRPQPATHPAVAAPITWRPANISGNRLVLDVTSTAGGLHHARFTVSSTSPVDVALLTADPTEDLTLNGSPIAPGTPTSASPGTNLVSLRCANGEPHSILHVVGAFRAMSQSPWSPGPNGTRSTLGPFHLEPPTPSNPRDLLASGVPFGADSVTVRGTVVIPVGSTRLSIPARADCAHLTAAGRDLGWAWGPDWSWLLPPEVVGKACDLLLKLVPSTFNLHGPHHHIDGDRHVVSPGQFEYVRNFADRPDAPECTRVPEWHFRPFGIDTEVFFG
jgi:hypothetical protein